MLEFENQSAIRAEKNNLLNSKVKNFRTNYSKSLNRVRSKSNIHTLAHTVYSHKHNQDFSTPMLNTASRINPERSASTKALKGLDMRASHIPNMSDINTELLMEKRKLEEHILFMKEQIAKETRARNKADTNWHLHRNNKEYCHQAYVQLCKKSDKLNQNIHAVQSENSQLRSDINKLQKKNQDTVNQIDNESKRVDNVQNKVNVLKSNLLNQEKERNNVKIQLVKQQRVMDSFSIQTKELQNTRAMVLLQINQMVLRNKL